MQTGHESSDDEGDGGAEDEKAGEEEARDKLVVGLEPPPVTKAEEVQEKEEIHLGYDSPREAPSPQPPSPQSTSPSQSPPPPPSREIERGELAFADQGEGRKERERERERSGLVTEIFLFLPPFLSCLLVDFSTFSPPPFLLPISYPNTLGSLLSSFSLSQRRKKWKSSAIIADRLTNMKCE